ncbi:hypothetical protein MPLSOD_80297 [Mesorhizobium sp. SOD10]|nr:hypothetical protein MPLSOD_80297 [Mesorhizobium sp. SOD10]
MRWSPQNRLRVRDFPKLSDANPRAGFSHAVRILEETRLALEPLRSRLVRPRGIEPLLPP